MAGLDTGALDRRITFERRTAPTSDILDAGEPAWTPVCTVWAQVRDSLPSRAEQDNEGLNIGRRPARVRIRYRTGLTSDMRIRHGERLMQIIAGPAEMGRRDGLEFMAEDYSTAGGGG